MSREPLHVKIRRDVDEEADNILGELSRLMSPALRTRAEQVAALAQVLKFPIPTPIAWMLDIRDVQTRDPEGKEYPSGSEGYLQRVADERGISTEEARRELLDGLRALGETASLRGRAAREAEAAEEVVDVPVVRKPEKPDVPSEVPPPREAPPRATVSVKPAVTPRTGPAARPSLDVQHVVVRPRSELGKPSTPTTPSEPAESRETYVRSDGATRVKPTHPGIEAMPEHLRGMPAASGKTPLSVRLRTAEKQFQVYSDVQANPGALTPEIAVRTDLPITQVGNYTRDLLKAGLIKQNGIKRLKHGVESGKVGNELVVVEGGVPPTPGRPPVAATVATVAEPVSSAKPVETVTPPAPTPPVAKPAPPTVTDEQQLNAAAHTSGSDLSGAELLKMHRDYAVSQKGKGPFTATKAADVLGVPVLASELMFSLLAESARGATVVDAGVPGLKAYEYNEMRTGVAGMGAAAQRDHDAAKARAHGNGTVSDPVARTGKSFVSQFSGEPAVQRLVRLAETKWPGSASKRGSQHIMIKTPNGSVTIGANSKGNALRKDQTLLERAGLVGAVQ